MADLQQIDVIRQGVRAWNEWRADNPRILLDLSRAPVRDANLNEANFRGVDFRDADLSGANLSLADLGVTNFRRANLTKATLIWADLAVSNLYGANLSDAILREADLTGADLGGTNLRGADLWKANLGWVNLSDADLNHAALRRALLQGTIFGNTNLKDALGLDACDHRGACTLDHRTISKSGPLPLTFLRGCGLPDNLVEYLPSLMNETIQFYSCFISYSTKDQDFAERLHADLQNKGVRCWFAPEDIQGGKKIHEQLDKAIRLYDKLLLILSEASMHSEWVKTEISKARKREKQENRRMLFPMRLVDLETLRMWECSDADTGKDSAREIREYYVPDFSKWNDHHSYQKAFERLIRDLKAESMPPSANVLKMSFITRYYV